MTLTETDKNVKKRGAFFSEKKSLHEKTPFFSEKHPKNTQKTLFFGLFLVVICCFGYFDRVDTTVLIVRKKHEKTRFLTVFYRFLCFFRFFEKMVL